jgi:hypothetical protein
VVILGNIVVVHSLFEKTESKISMGLRFVAVTTNFLAANTHCTGSLELEEAISSLRYSCNPISPTNRGVLVGTRNSQTEIASLAQSIRQGCQDIHGSKNVNKERTPCHFFSHPACRHLDQEL